MLSSVAALLLPPVTPFEFGTISEVFGLDRTEEGVPPFDFRVCGPVAGETLPSTIGVGITPPYGLEGLQGVDVVAVSATQMREFPEPVLDAVREAAGAGSTILSVCSGIFVLAAAGLLDGRRCTAHWMNVDELRERYPLALLDPDVLYVDDGNIITSAGTAAGIDACLHLVRRELGSAVVNAIARRMVVPPQRDGGQRQYVQQPIPQCSADGLAPVLDWVLEHLEVEHTVSDLARRARMSDRSFARRFVAETGTTPHRWLTLQRVLRAQRLLEDTDLGVDEVAERSGFGGGALLRHHFRKVVGVAPADYRRTFAGRRALAGQ
ncbi:GlxA family transcriptional regulator [Pseudonocardia nigra]|uniref:GlxA family transcriptional regulator n=1 Tax=Pseudonocardia nigra TaxID=1921578 RepID=UPI001C5D1E82|nr:helix-turn-helix domain-containing protein [Pseudonocardia nigra]